MCYASGVTTSSGSGGDALAMLTAALAALVATETANARLLVAVRRQRQERTQVWEEVRNAMANMEETIARDEAAATALEQRAGEVHAHIQDLRGIVADLRAKEAAGQAVAAQDVTRLAAVADRLEAVTAGAADDTTEPAPEPPPAP
jgi:septal ring factor EnvC (AmiA/AmiB activator)